MVATLDETAGRRETVRYSAYGVPFGMPSADVDGNGIVGFADRNYINAQIGKNYGDAGYTALLDVNLDGAVDATDYSIATAQSGQSLGHGGMSRAPNVSGAGNRIGYAGYAWEPSTSKYHVRHHVLDPLRGRWSRRDPLGHVDSPTAYAYVNDRAQSYTDPFGKAFCKVGVNPGCHFQSANDLLDAQGGSAGNTQPKTGKQLCLAAIAAARRDGGCDSAQLPDSICDDLDVQNAFSEANKECGGSPQIVCRKPGLQSACDADGNRPAFTSCSSFGGCGRITLCSTLVPQDVPLYLRHELIHSRQCGQHGYPSDDDTICREIEAYSRTGSCNNQSACCADACRSIAPVDSLNPTMEQLEANANCKSRCAQIFAGCIDGQYYPDPSTYPTPKYFDPNGIQQ